jgi:hypothetical protein
MQKANGSKGRASIRCYVLAIPKPGRKCFNTVGPDEEGIKSFDKFVPFVEIREGNRLVIDHQIQPHHP